MKKIKLFGICFFIFSVISMNTNAQSKTGVYQKKLTLPGKKKLLYTISFPKHYEDADSVPLVIALHFGWDGELPQYFGKTFLTDVIKPGMEQLGAIIVAPDCPSVNWKDPVSEAALLELYNFITNKHRIDKSKIIITGFSLGAIGTWHFISKHPSLFSASVIMAGPTPPDVIANSIGQLPVYIIHGSEDQLFSVDELKKKVKLLQNQGLTIEYKQIDGGSHYETFKYVPALKESVVWIKQMWFKN